MRLDVPKRSVQWLLENLDKPNIADQFEDETLNAIASDILESVERDESSRLEWKEQVEAGLKVAKQTIEEKSTPWPNAANTKDPLIAVAMMQFAARAGAEVIRGTDVVKGQVIGDDPFGFKESRSKRVGQYMSYQCLDQMPEWEPDTDQLLASLAGFGMYYKKTYYDQVLRRQVSCAVNPLQLVIHQDVKSLSTAERISERMEFTRNEVIERIRSGLWLDIEEKLDKEKEGFDEFIECHCWFDLDNDGYKEPYVVVVSQDTTRVVRIAPRYDEKGIILSNPKTIIRIEAIEYYTDFVFLPSPDGKFHKMGFFQLLGALNEEINTIQNQLIDAGTLANRQGGFIGRGVRLPSGGLTVRPGEWKPVEATGSALRDAIFPLPTKDPSAVLFNLLARLDDKGMKLASVSETMMGEQPGQNSPATSTLAILDQGLKVFTSILKRVFRAFKNEYRKLYHLNYLYLTDKEYLNVLDLSEADMQQIVQQLGDKEITETSNVLVALDFNPDTCDIQPIMDPTAASEALRLARAQAIFQADPMNPEIRRDYFKMLGVPESRIQAYLPPPPQGPPPEMIRLQADIESQKQKGENDEAKLRNDSMKLEQEEVLLPYKAKLLEAQALSLEAQAKKSEAETAMIPISQQLSIMERQFAETKAQFEMGLSALKHEIERMQPNGSVSNQGDDAGEVEAMAIPGGNPGDNGAPPVGSGGDVPDAIIGAIGDGAAESGDGMGTTIGGESGSPAYTNAQELADIEEANAMM